MTKLRAPLASHLSSRVGENSVQRIWRGVRRRRGERSRARLVWRAAFAGALFAAALVIGVLSLRPPQPGTSVAAASAGPLLSRTGTALGVLGAAQASSTALSDGSSIELTPGARLEVLENTAKTFASVLRSGQATFSVRPGGRRRWTIEAGLATVEVIGTGFSVTRSAGRVDIRVQHGIVLVRSDFIPDRVQRLTAGESLSVLAPVSVAPVAAVGPVQTAEAAVSAQQLPASSASDAPVKPATLEQLLDDANEHRRRGDVRGAEAALHRALAEHGSEPRGALAAFSLGKLLMDAEGRPADAARAFQRCLALYPSSALGEDALYRLADAQARSGDLPAAATTAREYRSRYPAGRHAGELKQWLGEH
jgi:transmembrane sensor